MAGDLPIVKLLVENLGVALREHIFRQTAANSTNVELMQFLYTRLDSKSVKPEPLNWLCYAVHLSQNLPMIKFLGSKFSLKEHYDSLSNEAKRRGDNPIKVLFCCAAASKDLDTLSYLFNKAQAEGLESSAIPLDGMFYYTEGTEIPGKVALKRYLQRYQASLMQDKAAAKAGVVECLSSPTVVSGSPLYTSPLRKDSHVDVEPAVLAKHMSSTPQ